MIYFIWIFQYIALAIVGFLVGFLICRLSDGPSIRTMKEQIEDLTALLMEAERLLSEKAEVLWNDSNHFDIPPAPGLDSPSEIWNRYNRSARNSGTDRISEQRIESAAAESEEFEETIVGLNIQEAERLSELSIKRKVRIRKLSGMDTKIKLLASFVGFEEERPVVGKEYRVLTQDEKVFSSSPVANITGNFIRTQNSIYEIEELMPS